MADVTIPQIGGGAISAASRRADDLYELQQSSGSSKYTTRENGFTYIESGVITLDSSNYLLNTTQLTVVDAPTGALQLKVPVQLALFLDHGGTDFDFDADGIDLVYSGATGTPIINIPQSVINASSDTYKVFQLETPLNTSVVFQDSLKLYAGADPTQGNSSVYIRVIYSLQDFTP